MKKSNSVRHLLGLKQKEIALLLGISRAQWSMYESGRRDLPVGVGKRLAEIVSQTGLEQLSREAAHEKIINTDVLQCHIKRLLEENDYQRLVIGRKLAVAEKKAIAELLAIRVSDALNRKHEDDQLNKSKGVKHIVNKANSAKTLRFSIIAFDLAHKLELLDLEKKLLESKLKNVRSNITDKENRE